MLTSVIKIDNIFDQNYSKLTSDPPQITTIFFLVEFYAYMFVTIKQTIINLSEIISNLNDIITDIIININGQTYYYIPQIFLPSFIKKIIMSIYYLIFINEIFTNLSSDKSKFYNFLISNNNSDDNNNNIISLGDKFMEYINRNLKTINDKILDLIKYHNDVLDFINSTSAYQLYIGKKIKIFDGNFTPLPLFRIEYSNVPNLEMLKNILKSYSIPNISYYDTDDKIVQYYNIFISENEPAPGSRYDITSYRNFIDLVRFSSTGKISNSPLPGENLQINFVATNRDPLIKIDYTVYPKPSISGEWLIFDPNNANNIFYRDAFIGYKKQEINIDYLTGMPSSIKQFLGKYLNKLKQQIIQAIIQQSVDNNVLNDTDVNKNEELENLFKNLKKLANETTPTVLDDVKVYVIIGKLTDSILNKLLEYTIRQSISDWIYDFIINNKKYHSLINLDKTINIIREKNYLKLSLQTIDKDNLINLLNKNIKIPQIEMDPGKIKYSTQRVPDELIHYLYNIDYFSNSNVNTNKKCYHIDPKIASKLITGETINSKNYDGNTPLHLAIYSNNSTLIELLISKGANPKGFKNIRGQTAYDIALINLDKHIEFSEGQKVIDSINKFVIPFNDLLISQLKDEKYGNNILKNISYGIPIQLIMYNHMFHLYLENYRYDLTMNIKKSITQLLHKYYNYGGQLYPSDLIEINNEQELEKILETDNISNKINSSINNANKKKK